MDLELEDFLAGADFDEEEVVEAGIGCGTSEEDHRGGSCGYPFSSHLKLKVANETRGE